MKETALVTTAYIYPFKSILEPRFVLLFLT